MLESGIWTWLLLGFGAITFLPLMYAQLIMLLYPKTSRASDLIVAKGETWRDKTHFRSALAFAWADWLVLFPLFIGGGLGIWWGQTWGLILWLSLGILAVYFSIIFWVMEKEVVYPSHGPWAYYTYFWGFFLYWGIAAIVVTSWQLARLSQ